MTRTQRVLHRRIWLALLFVLPALLALALVRRVSRVHVLSAEGASATEVSAKTLPEKPIHLKE